MIFSIFYQNQWFFLPSPLQLILLLNLIVMNQLQLVWLSKFFYKYKIIINNESNNNDDTSVYSDWEGSIVAIYKKKCILKKFNKKNSSHSELMPKSWRILLWSLNNVHILYITCTFAVLTFTLWYITMNEKCPFQEDFI